MSDVSQGDGWWEATDGKWYAPSTSPGAANQFCTNCASPVSVGASACVNCGFNPMTQRNFCSGCGSPTAPGQAVCTQCGRAVGAGAAGSVPGDKNKVAAGILGIILGQFGAHKFYLGYTTPALIMLGATLAGYCLGAGLSFLVFPIFLTVLPFAAAVVGIIEGIIYLTKTDQQFHEEYVVNEKDWF